MMLTLLGHTKPLSKAQHLRHVKIQVLCRGVPARRGSAPIGLQFYVHKAVHRKPQCIHRQVACRSFSQKLQHGLTSWSRQLRRFLQCLKSNPHGLISMLAHPLPPKAFLMAHCRCRDLDVRDGQDLCFVCLGPCHGKDGLVFAPDCQHCARLSLEERQSCFTFFRKEESLETVLFALLSDGDSSDAEVPLRILWRQSLGSGGLFSLA